MYTAENDNQYTETDRLISRYISGEAGDTECEQAEHWISQSDENKRYAESMRLAWEKTGQLSYKGRKDKKVAWKVLEKRIDEHTGSGSHSRFITPDLFRWIGVAASVIIVLGWFVFSRLEKPRQAVETVAMVYINTGNNRQSDTLPDGSVITLQPHSSLSYPSHFTTNQRNVNLSGSCFFSISHDASRPFKVSIGHITVTVLGTSFHITSSQGQTAITVKSGKVEVSSAQRSLQLTANEQLVITNHDSGWIKHPGTTNLAVAMENAEMASVKSLPSIAQLPVPGSFQGIPVWGKRTEIITPPNNRLSAANDQTAVTNQGTGQVKQLDTTKKALAMEISVKNLPPLSELPVPDKPLHAMLVGDKIPILPLDKWIKGKPVDLFDKSKVYLVDFWAVWCGPCIAGMEHLSDLQKKYKKDGLEVISVTSEDAWGNSYEKVTRFIKSKGDKFDYHFAWLPESYNKARTYKSIIYNPWLLKAYDSSSWALPQVFLVDRKGKFAFIGDGYSLTESYLKKVLDGNHDLEEERKNYTEKIRVEYNIDLFLSYLKNKQIPEAVQLGNAIVNHPQVNSHALIAMTDNLFNKYKPLLNPDLTKLAFAAALKGVAVTNSKSPGHLSELAKAYYLMNQPDEAVKTINTAISLAEGDFREALMKDLKIYKQEAGNK